MKQILLLLLCCIVNMGYTQTLSDPIIDSLKNSLTIEQNTSKHFDILYRIGKSYKKKTQLDSALHYIIKAKRFAKRQQNWIKIKDAEVAEAGIYSAQSNIEKAEKLYKTIIQFSRNRNDTLLLQGQTGLGRILQSKGENEAALKLHQAVLKLARQRNLLEHQAIALQNISTIYMRDDINKALEYMEKVVEVHQKGSTPPAHLAYAYLNISSIYGRKSDMKGVIKYAKLAAPILEKTQDIRYLITVYQNMNVAYSVLQNVEKSQYYKKRIIELADKSQNIDLKVSSLISLSESYRRNEEYVAAIKYSEEAVALTDSLELLESLGTALEILAKSYQGNKEFEASARIYGHALGAKDSLVRKRFQQKLSEQEISFSTKEKEQQILLQEEKLSRQNLINWVIGIIALLLLGFSYWVWQNLQHRKALYQKLEIQSQQLRSLDKAKSRFFANISHELRTPLTLIISPLNNALKRVKDTIVKEDLELAHNNSKKLLTLVNEILDLTKLESGQMTVQARPLLIEQFLRRILFSYHSLAGLRGFMLSFEYHLNKDLVLNMDAPKLEKIINNLLSNAFKYSNSGGVITLKTATTENNQLQIKVQDQGKGIAETDIKRIFDRFYQVERDNMPLQGGTGIGLSLAKELAEALGGTLTVKSELDKGTTFKVILPMEITQLNPKKVTTTMATDLTDSATITYTPNLLKESTNTILIVEDNPEMARFLEQMLAPYYQCTIATDGEKALKLLQINPYDLITSDVMMPNMDGFALLEKVRALPQAALTPFILLTARSLEEDKLKGLQLGVDDYITKPFNTNQLIARINNLLGNKQRRKTWIEQARTDSVKTAIDHILPADKALLKKAEQLVIDNIDNSKYRVEDLAKGMTYSNRQLSRVMQKMTGLTPVEFIREIRLLKAYQLLETRQYMTVSEVRFEVGFENASYFTKVFVKRFGIKPSSLLE